MSDATLPRVGGKNASLGEMVRSLGSKGVKVPPGFATTADAYWHFVETNGLKQTIIATLADLDTGRVPLAEAGQALRRAFMRGEWPKETADAIRSAYRELCRRTAKADADVAVRSSATAEDLPDASFAGQQESYLNIRGEAAVLDACRRCYASLFTDRAISYRKAKGFDHLKVALSVGVQQMVRSDLGASGVMFSIDTETGFDKIVVMNAAWGLGENVVQGAVDPDEYEVFKPLLSDHSLSPIIEKKRGEKALKMIYTSDGEHPTRNVPTSKAERVAFVLSDEDILTLARWACVIERPLRPRDGHGVGQGRRDRRVVHRPGPTRDRPVPQARQARFKAYRIKSKGRKLLSGLSIGDAVVAGRVCLIDSPREIARFVDGAILVTRGDRPGLGADHEAGGGDRHRSRRAHVARRDRQPRARLARCRRHRQCDPPPS